MQTVLQNTIDMNLWALFRDDQREEFISWLEANNIDPGVIKVRVTSKTIEYVCYKRVNGEIQLNPGGEVAYETKHATLINKPPAWWKGAQ